MTQPVFGLKVRPRPYKCTACSQEQEVQTNHTDACYAICGSCSWKMGAHEGVMLFGKMHRTFTYTGEAPTAEEINPHAL